MGGDGLHPALVGGARHRHHGEVGAVEGFGDGGGDGDRMVYALSTIGNEHPAPLGHRFEVGPGVVQAGQHGVAAVAGHVRSYRQRPGARPQNSHLHIATSKLGIGAPSPGWVGAMRRTVAGALRCVGVIGSDSDCSTVNVIPLWHSLFMVITQAQTRAQLAEAAVTRMLESVDDCSTGDLRRDLATSKAIASKLAAYQVRAAAVLAARERHGDGGAGVLRHATGVSRRQAESQVRTARVLEEMPAVREALESGRVSFVNAARLAQAAEGAEAGAVEADADLLARAESMPEDRFAREARRWTAKHQPDDGEAEYQRRRARRWLRLWDGDDGMTHLRGEFDPVTGERIRNRLEAEARRLRSIDTGDGAGGGGGKRSFAQAMADALDSLTTVGSSVGGPASGDDVDSRARGDRTGGPARGDNAGGLASGNTGGPAKGNHTGNGTSGDMRGTAGSNGTGGYAARGRTRRGADSGCDCGRRKSGGRPIADIAVVSHVDSATGELVSQLATGEPLPPSVLDLLSCNAALTGVLYDTAGTPLWRGTTKRTATAAQLSTHRPRRRLRRLSPPSGAMSGPSHQTGLARGPHHHRQHGAAVLELPQQGPPQPMGSHPPQRAVRVAATGPSPLGSGPCPLALIVHENW